MVIRLLGNDGLIHIRIPDLDIDGPSWLRTACGIATFGPYLYPVDDLYDPTSCQHCIDVMEREDDYEREEWERAEEDMADQHRIANQQGY